MEDNAELIQFRDNWRRELLERGQNIHVDNPSQLDIDEGIKEIQTNLTGKVNVPKTLEHLLQKYFPIENTDKSENSEKLHMSDIPSEIIMKILSFLDEKNLEICSSVCRNFFSLCKHPSLWKDLSLRKMKNQKYLQLVLDEYNNDWRKMLIHRPIIKFKGLYVSKVSYCRPGLTEGVHVQPVHLVVYWRLITFYEDGRCIITTTLIKPKKVMGWFRKRNVNKDLGKAHKVEAGVWKSIVDTPNQEERDTVIVNARTHDNTGTYTMRLRMTKRKNHPALKLLDYFELSDTGTFRDYYEIVYKMTNYYHYEMKREKILPKHYEYN